MPRVSVIIPTYNYGRFLGEAVQSVLDQTYTDFEVIVVDDGSTDNTLELVRGFPPEVKYFRQENHGLSAARNKGIELTEGEYLVFLDSDDVLLNDALEKSVAFLDQYPEAGFCYGQVFTIDEKGRSRRFRGSRGAKVSCIREGKEQIARMLFRGDIAPSAVLARRSCVVEAGLFNTNVKKGQDVDMWLRMAMRCAVGYLAEPLAKYRVHSQSLTSKYSFEAAEHSHTTFVQRALEGTEFGTSYDHIRKRAYFGLYCFLAGEAARRGLRTTGLRYLFKAIKAYPGMLIRKEGVSFLTSIAKSFLPLKIRNTILRLLITLRSRGGPD